MRSRTFVHVLAGTFLILGVIAPPLVHGQSIYGAVRGLVTDKGGAVVQDSIVTLTNEGTNAPRTTVTNSAGEYVFSQVVPSGYSISVEMKGFKKAERKGVIVETQGQVTVDVQLEVGNVTESISVTEEVPLLETSNASLGQVIDRQKIADLPILGRNPYLFSRFVANVAPVGHPGFVRMQDQSGSSMISIAGGPVRGNNYLIDGVPITDMNNRAVIIASLEAVQEMKVQYNTYDAEIGRSGGGMFNTLLKSGTNAYHGVLGGYIRQTDWLANLFFARGAGQPIVDQPFRNYYGSFGGPISVPKVYNGKDKTFFFFTFEGYRDTQAVSGITNMPTLQERAGDFTNSGRTIYDPTSTDALGNRLPFAGNIIPTTRQNAVGRSVANLLAQPNAPTAGFGSPNTNYQGSLPSKADQKTIKLDQRVGTWMNISASYLRYNSLEPGETWFPDLPTSPSQWRLDRRVDATNVSTTITVNPTTIVTARYGFNRFPNYSFMKYQHVDLAALGFSSNFVNNASVNNMPAFAFSNFQGFGEGLGSYVPNSHNFNATVGKYIGIHSLKAGMDYRKLLTSGLALGNGSGSFSFDNSFTRKYYASNSVDASGNPTPVSGADIADLLLGAPSAATASRSTKLNEFIQYYSGFVQDDIRLRHNLTINLGMRWEHETGLQEQNNNLIVGFDRNAVNSLSNQIGIPVKGAVLFPGINTSKTATSNPVNNKLSPRIGVAYQLDSKTTIRGGYGIFWAPNLAFNDPYLSEGYNATTSPLGSNDGGKTPAINLSDPFAGGIVQPVGNSRGDQTGLGIGLTIIDPNAKSTWIEQFSFDVQRELPWSIGIGAGYVGSRSHNLTLGTPALNINQLEPQYASLGVGALTASVTNPFYTPGGNGILGSATVTQAQLLRPFPAYGDINLIYSDQNKAKYDSLALRMQKRMSHGLNLLAAFTWSRAFDHSSGGVGNDANGNQAGPQNVYNLASEWAPSNFIAPFRFSTTISYDLPFGRGKAFAGNVNRWADLLVGGWSINLTNQTQSGFYLNILAANNDNSVMFAASERPNATGQNPATSGSVGSRVNSGWLNPAAFSQPTALTFGNTARTMPVLGPGLYNWDASVFKTFSITEKFKAQFRGEILNATNTPFFRAPNTSWPLPTRDAAGNLTYGTFGVVNNQGNFNRMVQMGLRVYF